MSNNQMVSVPRDELEAACQRFAKAQIFDFSRRMRALLTQPAEPHQGESVEDCETFEYQLDMLGSIDRCNVSCGGYGDKYHRWDDSGPYVEYEDHVKHIELYKREVERLSRLYTRPAQGEPACYTSQHDLDRIASGNTGMIFPNDVLTKLPLYTRADPAEVASIRRLAEDSCNALVKRCLEHKAELEALRAQLAEAHALLREVGESGFMVDGQIMPSNEALELQDRVDSTLSASAEPSAPTKARNECEYCGDDGQTCTACAEQEHKR